MNHDDIVQAVMEIVAEVCGLSLQDISADSHFVNDLGADGLSIVEVAVQAEDRLSAIVSDHDLHSVSQVGQMIACVARSVERAAADG